MSLTGEEALALANAYTDKKGGGGGGGTTDYRDLSNKPQINGHILNGNKTSSELGLASSQDVSDINAVIDNVNSDIIDIKTDIDKIKMEIPKVYGFHIDSNNSSPSSSVTYIGDAVGMTPAYMDYTNDVFNYGSWGDIWFIKNCKPCILNQDGTVSAYLNKNDYSKDIYGVDVEIGENLVGANVMIEFPKIWYKVEPDANNESSASVYISPVKVDEGYKDYAYIDYQGNHKEHFYMPAYNGSNVNSVLRSLSGTSLAPTLNVQSEIEYSKANGSGWYTEDLGEIMLINFLLILIGKSLDTQTVFGRGIDTGGEDVFNSYRTGAGNNKGMFWGSNDGSQLVKVFGIENWWGLQNRRYAGDINDNGLRKIKLCYGNEDGSTTVAFNTTGDGYVDINTTPTGTNGGYINKMQFTKDGMFSFTSNASSSTYYCDGQWFNNTRVTYAYRGGSSGESLKCGAFCTLLDHATTANNWYHSANISYK